MAASPAAAGAGPAGAGSSAVSGTKSTYATTVEHAAAVKPWTPEEPVDPANKVRYCVTFHLAHGSVVYSMLVCGSPPL